MDLRILRRPLAGVFSSRTQCLLAANIQSRRNESSYRRTKKRLNIKPDATFVLSRTSPQQDHIIFNPPASAPSVLHTPLKFLPKDDPRRKLFTLASTSTSVQKNATPGPVIAAKPAGYQRHHLSEEDVQEIRRLKKTNPDLWTSHKLAKKFSCSVIFVGMCVKATENALRLEREKLEAIRAKWGPKRTMAREDRKMRRDAVYRDE